jgi:hypothetical protein
MTDETIYIDTSFITTDEVASKMIESICK